MPSMQFPTQIDLVEFISHYAHDLRSPFNRIMGFSKIMLKGQDGPLTDFQREDLNTVYQNGVYAFTLVSNLVDIARLIAKEKVLSLAMTSISLVVDQALAQWKKLRPDQTVQFRVENQANTPSIQVDEAQFQQALVAIFACVLEFVQKPAQIFILVSEEPGWLVLTITSQGQLSKAPSQIDIDMYGYIGHTIVQLHGGQFRRQESGENGATICLLLPKNYSLS